MNSSVQRCRKTCRLGCVNHVRARARVTQPRPRIFLHFFTLVWSQNGPTEFYTGNKSIPILFAAAAAVPLPAGQAAVWAPTRPTPPSATTSTATATSSSGWLCSPGMLEGTPSHLTDIRQTRRDVLIDLCRILTIEHSFCFYAVYRWRTCSKENDSTEYHLPKE